MTAELIGIEIDLAQIASGIALGLVEKMMRGRVAARATGADGPALDLRAKLHGRNETVALGAVVTLRSGVALCTERSERAPLGGGEGDRDAGLGITVGLHDRSVVPLEPVDFAPGDRPAPEILHQAIR